MILDACGWCTGMTQRDGMGREEGGGFRIGNTCTPVAKPVQYCKVKKYNNNNKRKKNHEGKNNTVYFKLKDWNLIAERPNCVCNIARKS